MTSNAGPNANASSPDLWDQLDNGTYWQPLPAVTAEEYFSGETESMFISKDGEAWWLSGSRRQGATDYPTLEAAKAAGQAAIDEMYGAQHAKIVKDLGVDEGEWRVEIENGLIVLTSVKNGDLSISGSEGNPRWSVQLGAENDDAEEIMKTNDIGAALEAAQNKLVSEHRP